MLPMYWYVNAVREDAWHSPVPLKNSRYRATQSIAPLNEVLRGQHSRFKRGFKLSHLEPSGKEIYLTYK